MNEHKSLDKALNEVIVMLNEHLCMDVWMVKRVIGKEVVIAACSENQYEIKVGDTQPFDDSICSRMVELGGPNIVPNIANEEAYKKAPLASKLPISAYVGFPMYNENDELIATLCALDQNIQADSMDESSNKIETLVNIAAFMLNQHDTILRLEKAIHYLDAQSSIDDVTGLPTQDAFFAHAVDRKVKYDKLGCPLAIIVVEVAGLKINKGKDSITYDDLLRALSSDIRSLLRESDYLAKLDGSKFGVMLVNVEKRFVSAFVLKISKQLAHFNLRVSIGADVCREGNCIEDSIERANANKMI